MEIRTILTMSAKSSTAKLNPDVIVMKRSEDQLVLIHSSNNETFFQIKGEIACKSFDMLSKGKTQDQVIKSLTNLFTDAPLPQLRQDLENFTNKLFTLKILG